jgi:hypothetical protein
MEDDLPKKKEDDLQKMKKGRQPQKKILKKIKNNLTERNRRRPQQK